MEAMTVIWNERKRGRGRTFYYPHELLTCATMIKLPNVNKMKIYSRAFYLVVCVVVRGRIKRHIHSKQTNQQSKQKQKRANRTPALFLSYLRKLYSSYIISLLYSYSSIIYNNFSMLLFYISIILCHSSFRNFILLFFLLFVIIFFINLYFIEEIIWFLLVAPWYIKY